MGIASVRAEPDAVKDAIHAWARSNGYSLDPNGAEQGGGGVGEVPTGGAVAHKGWVVAAWSWEQDEDCTHLTAIFRANRRISLPLLGGMCVLLWGVSRVARLMQAWESPNAAEGLGAIGWCVATAIVVYLWVGLGRRLTSLESEFWCAADEHLPLGDVSTSGGYMLGPGLEVLPVVGLLAVVPIVLAPFGPYVAAIGGLMAVERIYLTLLYKRYASDLGWSWRLLVLRVCGGWTGLMQTVHRYGCC